MAVISLDLDALSIDELTEPKQAYVDRLLLTDGCAEQALAQGEICGQ